MRQLSPYEQTHLARFGQPNINIEKIGDMPVEYVTGKVEFMNRVFDINQDVLIPRPETEWIVDKAIELVGDENEPTIIDVGTGSGNMGISLFLNLSQQNKKPHIIMTEISEPALKIAKQNFANLVNQQDQAAGQANFYVSDVLADVPHTFQADVIVANLPYIPASRISYLDKSVVDYEPHIALDGGPQGTTLIQRLLEQAVAFLKPNGSIILEIDHTHQPEDLLPQSLRNVYKIEIVLDTQERQRYAILHLSHK